MRRYSARILAHSMRTELVPALDRISVRRGLCVGELIVAALVTGAARSHTAVGEPLLVMNTLSDIH
jgi:hypothetical protein